MLRKRAMQSMTVSQSSEASVFSLNTFSRTREIACEKGRLRMLSRSIMEAVANGFWFYLIIFSKNGMQLRQETALSDRWNSSPGGIAGT
jgi:hypothetical protein